MDKLYYRGQAPSEVVASILAFLPLKQRIHLICSRSYLFCLIKSIELRAWSGNYTDLFEILTTLAEDGTTQLPRCLRPIVLSDQFPARFLHCALVYAIRCRDTDLLDGLLKNGRADPSVNRSVLLVLAAKRLHWPTINLLLEDKRVDPMAHNNYLLNYVIDTNHEKIVKLLVHHPHMPPRAKQSAISRAYWRNRTTIIQILQSKPDRVTSPKRKRDEESNLLLSNSKKLKRSSEPKSSRITASQSSKLG